MNASMIPTSANKQTRSHRRTTHLAILASIMAICFCLPACSNSNSEDLKTVAVCNGYEIPYDELRFVTTLCKSQMAQQYGEHIWDDPETAEQYRSELKRLVTENLNENYLVLSACKNLGIATSDSTIDNYVDQQMDALRDEYDSKKEYKAALLEQGLTERYARFTFSIAFLESVIHYTLLDNDLYEFRYEDNASEFIKHVVESGEYVRTLHVYIENAEGEDPAANLAEAQEISDRLQAAATVEERRNLLSHYIGSTVNDDLTTVTGDGYYFMRGEMIEAYEEASFDLAIGEVSEPVVCGGGNFVIMRLQPDEAYVSQKVQDLMNTYYGVCLEQYIEQFRAGCEVYFTEYGDTLDLLALE